MQTNHSSIKMPHRFSNQNFENSSTSQIDKSYYNLIVKLLVLGLTIVSIYLASNRPSHLTFTSSLIAISIIWCGFLPSIIFLNNEVKVPFPFLPMFGIVYSIWFGFSAFNDEIIFSGGQTQIHQQVLVLVLSGMVIFFLSFYISKITIWKKVGYLKLPNHFSLKRLRIILWGLLSFNIFSSFSPLANQLGSLNLLFQPSGFIAFGSFYILRNRGHLSALESSIIFFIFFPLEVIIFFSTGTLGKVFFFFLFMLFIYWYEIKRIPWILLLCFVLSFIFINPVKNDFRSLTWNGGIYQHANFLDKSVLFSKLIYQHHFKQKYSSPRLRSAKKDLNRVNHISEMSLVMELTPSIIPYWKGETYKGVFIKFIPRMIWPEKPKFVTGNMFGHRYGLIGSGDLVTSVNLQWTIEMYANFGKWGVIIGMGFVGILLAFAEKKFNQPEMTFLEFIVGLTILFPLTHPEASLVEMLGALIPTSIALYIIFNIGLRLNSN